MTVRCLSGGKSSTGAHRMNEWILRKLDQISLQTDPFALVVAMLSLVVSAYIAFMLHRLSKRFQQNEATRAINHSWDSFHNAMLNKEVHDLFWGFVNSSEGVKELGERSHHIVLMYINNIHTEYHTFRSRIFSEYQLTYLDTLLEVFANRRQAVLDLARLSGYDAHFLTFLDQRLQELERRASRS